MDFSKLPNQLRKKLANRIDGILLVRLTPQRETRIAAALLEYTER